MINITITEPFKYAYRGCDVVQFECGTQDVPEEVADIALAEGWAHLKAPENKDEAPRRRVKAKAD